MSLSIRLTFVVAMIAAAVILLSQTAFAGNPHDGTEERPGWGYGDKNHTHTGPPGQSVRP